MKPTMSANNAVTCRRSPDGAAGSVGVVAASLTLNAPSASAGLRGSGRRSSGFCCTNDSKCRKDTTAPKTVRPFVQSRIPRLDRRRPYAWGNVRFLRRADGSDPQFGARLHAGYSFATSLWFKPVYACVRGFNNRPAARFVHFRRELACKLLNAKGPIQHPYMRLLLSRHDRALPTMVAQRISRRTVVDWGSSYPQRALHNLTYGPIAGRGTLDRNHNASCTRLRSRLTRPT